MLLLLIKRRIISSPLGHENRPRPVEVGAVDFDATRCHVDRASYLSSKGTALKPYMYGTAVCCMKT